MFRGAPTDTLGRTFKARKWMLLSARERLDHKDKLVLATLMTLNAPLYQAYLLKEQLRGILQHGWTYIGALRRNRIEWIDAVMDSDLFDLMRVAERISIHLDAVVAGHEHDVKLGLVEAINSKISWISPFHYYPAFSIVAGDAPAWRNVAVLLSSAAVLCAIGYWRFERRDL